MRVSPTDEGPVLTRARRAGREDPLAANILIVTLDRRGATRAPGHEPADTPAVATGEVAFYWIYILFKTIETHSLTM